MRCITILTFFSDGDPCLELKWKAFGFQSILEIEKFAAGSTCAFGDSFYTSIIFEVTGDKRVFLAIVLTAFEFQNI